jgi:hypothetical protein
MLINFSGELEKKGQSDSSCRMLEDNIKIDIKCDVRVCVRDLCTSSRIHMPPFVNAIMNFNVNKMRVIMIWPNNYQLLKDGRTLLS